MLGAGSGPVVVRAVVAAEASYATAAGSVRRKASIASRTAASAAASGAPRIIGVIALTLRADCDWPSLNLAASLLLLCWIHAVALGKVLANSVCTHGRILHSQPLVFEAGVTLVLPVVHSHYAIVSMSTRAQGEMWLRPLTPIAEVCKKKG